MTFEANGARIDSSQQYFAMNPDGPDVCRFSNVRIPAWLSKAIPPMPANTTRHNLLGRKLINNSCLYVCVDNETRLSIEEDNKEMYWLPFGKTMKATCLLYTSDAADE